MTSFLSVTPSPLGRVERVDPARVLPDLLLEAAGIIRHGGAVAYPTETFYGLAVDPFDKKAVERLFALKQRPAGQPLILLLAQTEEAFDLAAPSGAAKSWFLDLARAFWPGPLTLVLPARASLACPALAASAGVAVRISSHPLAQQLARSSGMPITSTSANVSGEAPPASADAIDQRIAAGVDLILDGGPTPGDAASTILDLTGQRPVMTRAGGVTREQISRVLGFTPRVGLAAA
jgi:L-threonylcarbamoyladenylate synthase